MAELFTQNVVPERTIKDYFGKSSLEYGGLELEESRDALVNLRIIGGNLEGINYSNLMLYDAVVDANGHGDFIDIQSAIDAGKTRIFVRSGTYTIISQINITSSNVFIVGENKADTVLKFPDSPSSDYDLMHIGDNISTYSNITIQNLRFDGNRANQSTADKLLNVQKINDLKILNCDFVSAYHTGIYFQNNVTRGLVSGCFVSDNRIYGINFAGSTVARCWIVNNYIYGVDLASSYGIYLQGDTTVVFGNVIMNYINACFVTGERNVITSNIIESNNVGILMIGADYNTISDNYIGNVAEEGIDMQGSDRNRIIGNMIEWISGGTNDTYSGIFLQNHATAGNCTHNIINGNTIYDHDTSNYMKYGIREEDANQDYNIICENIISGAVTANLSIQGVNTEVAHNIS